MNIDSSIDPSNVKTTLHPAFVSCGKSLTRKNHVTAVLSLTTNRNMILAPNCQAGKDISTMTKAKSTARGHGASPPKIDKKRRAIAMRLRGMGKH